MSELSPGLGLPYLHPSQAQKHVTHNAALQRLDQLVQLRLGSLEASTPPVSPVPAETHALGSSPTGAWAGQERQLASWDGSVWQFVTPQEGWLAWDLTAAELRVWNDTAQAWLVAAPTQLGQLGIATAADGVNRLAVSSPATLLTHSGGGHQLKLNKASDGETASLLFQSNWTGHAELGLAGETAFTLKVSGDGSSWNEVMRADPVAQRIDWAAAGPVQMSLSASALQLDLPLTGAAVQSDATDTTAGRLMRADYGYGPGNLLGVVSQTAGAPSGAALESGSNANGHYLRLADGTQWCWSNSFSLANYNGASCTGEWVFPASFAAVPTMLAMIQYSATIPNITPGIDELKQPGWVNSGNNINVGKLACYRDKGGVDFESGDSVTVMVSAVGRWY